MKLDVTPLRCFLAVEEEGSFSRAAQRLNMTQPSVTAQIKSLEELLDLKLFERSTRSVAPTPAGRALTAQARRALQELDGFKAVAQRLRRAQKGALRLGAAIYTLDFEERVRVLDDFAEASPEIDIGVDFNMQEELKLRLEAGDLDAILMIAFPVARSVFQSAAEGPFGAELLAPDDLPRIVLRRRPILLGVPEESALAQHRIVPAEAIAGMELAFPLMDHGAPFIERLQAPFIAAGARLITPPEGHAIGIERYATRRRIPTITLGWFPPRPGQMEGMVVRPFEGLDVETEFAVVFNQGPLSPAARLFHAFLQRQDWPEA